MGLIAAWTAVAAVAAALMYLWRRSPWRSCAVVLATGPLLALTFLLTGPSVAFIFERAASIGAGTIVAAVLALLVATRVLPQLHSRADRWPAAALCAMLTIGFAAVAVMLWRVADDGLQLGNVPVASTGEEVLAWRNTEPSKRIYGVLAVAHLGAPPGSGVSDKADRGLLASFGCGRGGPSTESGPATWLPSSFSVTFADDIEGWAQGITSVRQAWNWPASGGRSYECGLRAGDPVIVWGDPAMMRDSSGRSPMPAITEVRVLAYGDLDRFRDGFVPAAQRTGQATLAFAVLNALLMASTAVLGWLGYRRLDRDGTDGPARITWSRT